MDDVTPSQGATPAGAAEPSPTPEPSPATAPATPEPPAPTEPTVPPWVNAIDQVPQAPQYPVPQAPPMVQQYPQYQQPPYQQYQPPQPPQASLDAIAQDPQLVPRLSYEMAQRAVHQAVGPLAQAFEYNRAEQTRRDAAQAIATAKNHLIQTIPRDPSFANPAVAQGVQQAYAYMSQAAMMGNPGAIASLYAPETVDAVLAIVKRRAGMYAPNPVAYTGAAAETGRGTATTAGKRTLTPEEDSLRQEWGMTVDQWFANEKENGG